MYNTILSALETKLSNFATAQGYEVAWPDIQFSPNGSYLESFILPAETGQGGLSVGSYQEFEGIYQINVVTRKGNGTADSRAMVDAVLAEFSKGSMAGTLQIQKSWASGSFDRDESYFVVPVSVRYKVYA